MIYFIFYSNLAIFKAKFNIFHKRLLLINIKTFKIKRKTKHIMKEILLNIESNSGKFNIFIKITFFY
jgi:hypothetical protein